VSATNPRDETSPDADTADDSRIQLEAELRRQVSYDPLTGLANRLLFTERAQHALNRRDLAELVVCFVDLDDFKDVNDRFGHGAGDELLRVIGERLRECVRPADTIARFGGDEFAVLLEATELAEALEVVDRLYTSVGSPIRLGDEEVLVRLSVGMTTLGGRRVTPEELVLEADAAMYAAKARGKNRYEIFDPSMRSASELRARLRIELGAAITNGDFELYFQPVVDLASNTWCGIETLTRWAHPQHGLLEPGDFVDLAETKGLIVELDRWALAAACSAVADLPHLSVTVNISGRTLRDQEFGELLESVLRDSGLAGSRLVLDVADVARDPERARTQIEAAHSLGVAIALDDFDGDIASLRRLRTLDLDYLKIHHVLVSDLHSGRGAATIAGALIDIAHELGMRAVATGVETEQQLDTLTLLGCDLGEGYLWAGPASIGELTDRVAAPVPRS
jgi:diguanylate cyclase (GGDEF)-like protein